jgi:hypothetical protein
MTPTTLVLALLATYRLTLLALYDRITRPARLWLRDVGHHPGAVIEADEGADSPNLAERRVLSWCECGEKLGPVRRYLLDLDDRVLVDDDLQGHSDLAELHRIHVASLQGRGWRYLLSCPWCLSIWFGAVVAATALAWGDGWGWQLIAGTLAASGLTGLGASVAHPPDDDHRYT